MTSSRPASPVDPKATTKKRTSKGGKKKSTTESVQAPIFLKKTFQMIDTCDPSIATWTEDGSMFMIKDTDIFASQIICQYFKHNNFSSFVRQLNFYGFRKIKSDPLRIRDAEADIEAKYWRFRHEKFLKGRPELLSEIKKSSHTEAAEKQEVDALKNEVKDLKEKLESTTRNMEKLASMVEIMMKSQQSQHEMLKLHQAHQNQYVQDGISKKRKVIPEPSLPPSPVKSSVLDDRCPIQPLPVTSLPDPSTACDSDLYGGSPSLGIYSSPSLLPATPSCEDSIDSLSPMDELLHSLFSNEGSNNIIDEKPFDIPDLPLSSNFAKSSPPEPDALLVQKLRSSLAKLPKELQELFVERLVAVIADPEKFQNQVEAVSALAAMAAEEAKKKLKSNGGNSSIENNNEEAVEVATAVLGSFLARYGASLNGKAVAQAQASMVPMET